MKVDVDDKFLDQLLALDLSEEIELNLKDIKVITLRRTE